MPPVTSSSPTTPDSRPLRIALIGAGRHAQHHARAIVRCPGVQLVAVADPSDAALGAMRDIVPGIGCFKTPEELFASEQLDVVHIITPPVSHAPLARMALKAGCHIYVEKPFTESVEDAQQILETAKAKGLRVCAGHQLLYEPPTRLLTQYLPSIGRVVHVESYFSFRTVRHAPGGRKVLRADHQLLDILPHPVYLLLQVLEQTGEGHTELLSLEVSQAGTVHALVRRGGVTGTLIVTLEGRPVESYLRVIGRNGSLFADYVRSTTQRAIGPGSSGIDKLFAPYRQAWQLLVGTTSAMANRFLKSQRSYPGMVELFSAFYESARSGGPSPLSPESLLETVRICERVAQALKVGEAKALAAAAPRPVDSRGVLVTGGQGFLGKEIVRELLSRGRPVRVVARREPSQGSGLPARNMWWRMSRRESRRISSREWTRSFMRERKPPVAGRSISAIRWMPRNTWFEGRRRLALRTSSMSAAWRCWLREPAVLSVTTTRWSRTARGPGLMCGGSSSPSGSRFNWGRNSVCP